MSRIRSKRRRRDLRNLQPKTEEKSHSRAVQVAVSVHNINDHMAYAHSCGSVRFHLLRSGAVECANCNKRLEFTVNYETAPCLTYDEIMDAFQEAFPRHELHQESIDFARAVERRVLEKFEQHCGDPDCDECVPPGPRSTPTDKTFWLIERGSNQGQSPTVWWSARPDAVSSYSWVESVHKATRFDSAEAAEKVAQERYLTDYAVTSHNFMVAAVTDYAEGRKDERKQWEPVALRAVELIDRHNEAIRDCLGSHWGVDFDDVADDLRKLAATPE